MTTAHSSHAQPALAAQVRQKLVHQAAQAMSALLAVVQERLTALLDEAAPSREMQVRRDAWTFYQRHKGLWQTGVLHAWQVMLAPGQTRAIPLTIGGGFELVGTEVVENKIMASRLALGLMEDAAGEVNDLRKRLKALGGDHDLSPTDIVHPEVLLLPVVEQWALVGLSPEAWQLVADTVQHHMTRQLKLAYAACNQVLVSQGVLPVIEFSARVTPGHAANMGGAAADTTPRTGPVPASAPVAHPYAQAQQALGASPRRRAQDHIAQLRAAGGGGGSGGGGMASTHALPGAEQPWHAGREQALQQQVAHFFEGVQPAAGFTHNAYESPASPTLMAALSRQPLLGDAYANRGGVALPAGSPVVIERVASQLRQQSADLKAQAHTEGEKAIIELVALMFQSILQEDRIPTGIRVWFARLQMPVLRVALAEPDFFQRMNHPARQLIDHMGSCVMGFDASGINSAALELEIKRVVQVIEQYPDTGERVYKRVYDEFQVFLKQHLTQKPITQKVMGVAQQVEQKETLTIQFTIEMRNQLKDMPVRDEIREFLFKVWAEVLAVCALRHGLQHDETLLLKKTASDLIWAASAKPNRSDRARVISDLPELMQCLRAGMTLLGVAAGEQDSHIKVISDILADAFMSKTESIADEQIQALAARLAHLEDYISDDGLEELPLDTQSIEELLDIDASEIDVVIDGGGTASPVMLEWARDLDLGAWFRLDHNGQVAQVQYVWRSPMGHLHLFASNVGHSYLIQSVRLAAYLQSGLIEPQEAEPLTQRATRDALGKLEANPERIRL